jgi:TonB family protein
MEKRLSLVVLVVCIIAPMALVAQEAKEVLAKPAIAVTSAPSKLSVLTATNPVQDKQKLPYDQAPEAKTTVQPKYPDLATKAGIEGTVWTNVSIDTTGKVTNVTITKSDAEIFNQPSINAAMQWAFKPALKEGKPIAVDVAIPFRFKIKGAEITDYSELGMAPLFVAVSPRSGYRVTRQHPYLIGQSPTTTNEWYPESAIKDKFDGIVMLKLTVNLYGRVERVEIEGHAREDLDSAAVQLARTWTFTPGQANGMPEKCVIRVPVSFHLGRSKN